MTALAVITRRSSEGFTLIEVLVALAVLAIALPALMLSISEQVIGLSHLRDKSIAHWVAMNKLTELRLQNAHKGHLPKDRKKGSTEMLGREWFWQLETEKTSNDQLLEVKIAVRTSGDDDESALANLLHYFVLPTVQRTGVGSGNSTTGGGASGNPASPTPGAPVNGR
ncbi:MAG: type II secretion system minor pseudopilin GspI [Pseudomonadales bacterium]